jgi:hypothetical protein
MMGVLAGKVDTFETDPKRKKRIYESSTATMKGWREAASMIRKVYALENKRLTGEGGGKDKWAEAYGVTAQVVG